MEREGEPGLHPQMHPAQPPIDPVEVIVQALPLAASQFEFFALTVGTHLVRPTQLHAAQDADQAFADLLLFGDPLGLSLLVGRAAGQIHHRPARRRGQPLGGLANPPGHVERIAFEVLEQHPGMPQVVPHPVDVGQPSQGSPHSQPIPTAQDPNYLIRVPLDKMTHGVTPVREVGFCNHHTLPPELTPFFI